ncbi:MAG: heme-binding domain-containing protein [Bacteroidota bacterium]|nr:heme-binding domain-containing protein [Bacteroidota bacterium]
MLKKIGIALLVILLVMQAFRPAKNNSGDMRKDISVSYVVPADVKTILAKACNDCHSNATRYPWYSEIQPVSWWLSDHIKDGKRHFNFNEFEGYRVARQYKKLEECIDEVKKGDMPLASYTIIHKDAILSDEEKNTLFTWLDIVRDSIKSRYPADSLIIKKKS